MISADTALSFFTLSVLLGVTPGPDNIFVLMQSAQQGRRSGVLVTLGLCTGLLFHTAAVALGLAAMLAAAPLAFTALKLAGAAYLLYLAWGAWRAPAAEVNAVTQGRDGWHMYRRGVMMNLTNPKVGIFFMAFLPQFVEPGAGPVAWQVIGLGALFVVATLLVFGGFAWFAGVIGHWLRRSARAQQGLNRLAALVFVGLAVRLAIQER